MISICESEIFPGIQYHHMNLYISNQISSPLSHHDEEMAGTDCIGYHARSKGIIYETLKLLWSQLW